MPERTKIIDIKYKKNELRTPRSKNPKEERTKKTTRPRIPKKNELRKPRVQESQTGKHHTELKT